MTRKKKIVQKYFVYNKCYIHRSINPQPNDKNINHWAADLLMYLSSSKIFCQRQQQSSCQSTAEAVAKSLPGAKSSQVSRATNQ